MTIKELSSITTKLVRYNLKIVFAGKFIWFMLAALVLLLYFMIENAWERNEINEQLIYNILVFPGILLIFYPAVFGIQNDADNRALELLFGIPDYKYKVWGLRLLMMYVAIFFILILFAYLSRVLLYPVAPLQMAVQVFFPVLFMGTLAFMMSTIIRSGNGTAVVMILLGIALYSSSLGDLRFSFWNIFINPFEFPKHILPVVWENTITKSRIFLSVGSIVCMMIGLMNLQQREKFIG